MQVTMKLIKLQTICLANDESLLNEVGYKTMEQCLGVLAKVYEDSNESTKKYMLTLMME